MVGYGFLRSRVDAKPTVIMVAVWNAAVLFGWAFAIAAAAVLAAKVVG